MQSLDNGNCQDDSVKISRDHKAETESPDRKKTLRKRKKPVRKEKTAVKIKNNPVKKRKKKAITSITKIASLVFFDLDTTGLGHQIGKKNVQITELSMVAIKRDDFERKEDPSDIRITQRLCLCTRPRSRISSGAAEASDLHNEDLKDQNPFDQNTAEAINSFLSHLPKPVCLIAHNGNSYDFPILKAELSRLEASLPSELLIADSLRAFRALGVPASLPGTIPKCVKFTKNGNISYSFSNLYLYFFHKSPINNHSYQNCNLLMKICHQMKDSMLLWFDEKCGTFDRVSPMW